MRMKRRRDDGWDDGRRGGQRGQRERRSGHTRESHAERGGTPGPGWPGSDWADDGWPGSQAGYEAGGSGGHAYGGRPGGYADQYYGGADGYGSAGQAGNAGRAYGSPAHDDPAYRDRAYGDRAYGDRAYGDRAYGDRAYGDRAYGDRAYGERAYGDPAYGDRAYGEQVHGERAYGERAYGDPAHHEGRLAGPGYSDPANDAGPAGYEDPAYRAGPGSGVPYDDAGGTARYSRGYAGSGRGGTSHGGGAHGESGAAYPDGGYGPPARRGGNYNGSGYDAAYRGVNGDFPDAPTSALYGRSAADNLVPTFSPADGSTSSDSAPSGIPRPYGRLSIFTLLDDKAKEFDRLAEEAAEGVRISEPGTLVYVIHVVPKAPMQRIIYEIYRDRSAFEAHERQPHIQRFVAERASCVLATNIVDLRLKYAKVAAQYGTPQAGDGSKALPTTRAARAIESGAQPAIPGWDPRPAAGADRPDAVPGGYAGNGHAPYSESSRYPGRRYGGG